MSIPPFSSQLRLLMLLGNDGRLYFVDKVKAAGGYLPDEGFLVRGTRADGSMDLVPISATDDLDAIMDGIRKDEKEKAILEEQTQRFSAMELAPEGFEPCDAYGEKLVAGTRVQLFGLTKQPDLNNTYGRIVTYSKERGRFGVQREEMVEEEGQVLFGWVDMEHEAPMAVKPEKLRISPRLPAAIGTAAGSRRGYAQDTKYVLDWLDSGGHIEARHPVYHDTVLTLACANGASALANALVKRGADVEARAMKETTPLMYAAFGGHVDIVRMLLSAGASVNAVSSDGGTALGDAVRSNHVEVAAMLREAGAYGLVHVMGA